MSETWKKATFITPSRQSLGGKLDLLYSSKYWEIDIHFLSQTYRLHCASGDIRSVTYAFLSVEQQFYERWVIPYKQEINGTAFGFSERIAGHACSELPASAEMEHILELMPKAVDFFPKAT